MAFLLLVDAKPVSRVSQGFYSRWGQLGHFTKLHALATDIATDSDNDREIVQPSCASVLHSRYVCKLFSVPLLASMTKPALEEVLPSSLTAAALPFFLPFLPFLPSCRSPSFTTVEASAEGCSSSNSAEAHSLSATHDNTMGTTNTFTHKMYSCLRATHMHIMVDRSCHGTHQALSGHFFIRLQMVC